MGILSTAIAAIAGTAVVSKLLGRKEEQLNELDNNFKHRREGYETRRKKLLLKIEKGGFGSKAAEEELDRLDKSFEAETAEYYERRKKLLPKKTKEEKELEKIKLMHDMEMKKIEYEHTLREEEEAKRAEEERKRKAAEFERHYKSDATDSSSVFDKSTSTDFIFCYACGAKLKKEARFCTNCGQKLID